MDIDRPEDARRCPESEMDLTTLTRLAQGGSASASQVLFDRCRTPLLAVIRDTIQPPLRRLYDSDDFLGETFIQIFTTYFTDEILRSPDTLWPYLKRIAENKVRDANRKYLHTERHNINRVTSLESMGKEERDVCLWARDISPTDALLLKELVEERLVHLVSQLPAMMQKIIQLLLGGATTGAIAQRLGVEPKRVYRAMDWLKKQIRE
jgi:RNA polymerase sigma factor (sigma-70 family)